MEREEEGELLHGLARERSVWREWEGGRERGLGDGSQVKRVGLMSGARGWEVAPRLCAHDTHQRCTGGPSASEERTVRGWVTRQ